MFYAASTHAVPINSIQTLRSRIARAWCQSYQRIRILPYLSHDELETRSIGISVIDAIKQLRKFWHENPELRYKILQLCLLSRVDSKWLSRANLHSEKTFCYCWNSHGWWLSSLRLGTGHISNWFQLGTYSGLSSKLHAWHGVANDSEKIWWEICYNYWFWVTSKLLGRLPEFKQPLL